MTLKVNQTLFHPLELSFCGHSGSGKTTLIKKLIRMFSNEKYTVGYIKHDAHHFDMDKKGKDTFVAKEAGSSNIAISSPKESALILNCKSDEFTFGQNFIDSDIVFIEGYKNTLCRKIFMWTQSNEDYALLKKYLSSDQHNLLAMVGTQQKGPTEAIPYFKRSNVKGIHAFVKEIWASNISSRPLYGLVLAGGHSKRMGKNKALLSYNGKAQVKYLYELLKTSTSKVYVSCRSEQSHSPCFNQLNLIEDRFVGFGAVGGILSALKKHPNAAWFVVACDMPFINKSIIDHLIENRNPYRIATCFYNEYQKWPEPLCAIYEPKSALRLGQYLAIDKYCPRKILMNSNIQNIKPLFPDCLSNINTPEEFKIAQTKLNTQEISL